MNWKLLRLRSGGGFLTFLSVVMLLALAPVTFVEEAIPEQKGTSQSAHDGSYVQWSKVEIALTGPESAGMSESNNPFLIDVFVQFTSPTGAQFEVPAFYEGDGKGGLDGNVWRARFAPDTVGTWQYQSSSDEPLLDGHSGTFEVTAPAGCSTYVPGSLPDFSCTGRLQAVNQHYLALADGTYWLKGGADDPEDFLAPGQTVGFPSKEAAVDYLAAQGVNSMYIMLHNVGGDEENVWPWVGDSDSEAEDNHEHFDVEKLAEWENLFTYIEDKGIVLHLVLEDDSGWSGFNRNLYYREMVARFGHHNGLYWNLSEEYNENYSSSEAKSFAELLSSLDAYDHPLTIHHQGSTDNWEPFVNDAHFDLTSFQSNRSPQNDEAAEWFEVANGAIPTLATSFDETGKIDSGDRTISRHIVWSVYMGGASFEMHTSPLSDYRDFADHFADMHRARTFFEQLPLYQMQPINDLVTSGEGYLFARPGLVYAAYLPEGDTIEIDLSSTASTFDVSWFDPRSGATQTDGATSGGATRSFTAPNDDDWVLLLERSGGGNVEPFATNGVVQGVANGQTTVSLTYYDDDGPGPYTFSVIDGPEHGTLQGSDANRIYMPDPGFTGSDSFTWRVNDGLADSNTATIIIQVSEGGDIQNQAPLAESKVVHAEASGSTDIQLTYMDPDNGPGPYSVEIQSPVRNGTLEGANNDWTYTPDPGFLGFDSFRWVVSDGEDDSDTAVIIVAVLADPYERHLPSIYKAH